MKHSMYRPLLIMGAFLTAVFPVLYSSTEAYASATINEYTVPTSSSQLTGITTGPDGALWFTEYNGNKIGRMTTSGQTTEYNLADNALPQSITTGPDGALWFTESGLNKIGRITTMGDISEYPTPVNGVQPWQIVTGSDGALWFSQGPGTNEIGRITTSGDITEYPTPNTGAIYGITAGPDGALWYVNATNYYIGRMTTAGVATEWMIPTTNGAVSPIDITSGPDGALWFTEYNGNKIGRVTTSGDITQYTIPTNLSYGLGPTYITTGPDGALWFTEHNGDSNDLYNIGRITTSGDVTEYPIPTPDPHPNMICLGPDGALWFTEGNTDKIGKLTISLSAPTNLTAMSPTNSSPALSWNSVSGATSYNIYRNGIKIGSNSNTTYADNSAPEGTNTYSVSAVGNGIESSMSNSTNVIVDRTAPALSNLTVSSRLILIRGTISISASATDNITGVFRGEYYIDTDPGQGNGSPMVYANGQISTSAIIQNLSIGQHRIFVRAEDNAGNWSTAVQTTIIFI